MKPGKDFTRDEKIRYIEGIAESDDSFFADYSDELVAFATDDDPSVRIAAIERLWAYPSRAIIDTLFTLLSRETDSTVRSKIISAMGRYVFELEDDELLGDDDLFDKFDCAENGIPSDDLIKVKQFLIDTYSDLSRPLDERRNALESLAFSSDENVQAMINDAYATGEKQMVLSALFSMGRSGLHSWSGILAKELSNQDRDILLEAIRACGNAGLFNAGKKLEHLTYAKDREIALAAIWALGQSGWKDGFDRLNELSSNRDAEIRDIAETAMEEWFVANGEIDFPS